MVKGTKITAKQAKLIAETMKKKTVPFAKKPVAPVDVEDELDGGADEDTE
jgi:hypothetical protein